MSLPFWLKKFTVTFSRLKNTAASYYTVALGIKGWDIDISSDPSLTIQVHSSIPSSSDTGFELELVVEDNTRYQNLKFTYLAINWGFSGLWVWQET